MRWTEEDLQKLRDAYVAIDKPVALDFIAKVIGRNKANVCRKARELGLTNQRRQKVEVKKPPRSPKFKTNEELRKFQSDRQKKWIADHGHPRGALGMKHSEETLKLMAESSRRAWQDPNSGFNTPEAKQRRSDFMVARIISGKMRSGYSRSRGGKREDLGDMYFRSSWEANYARFLNFLLSKGEIEKWEYEPKTFEFIEIKRGTRAYTPDFKVYKKDGSYVWHEVKGWMDNRSRTRLSRFSKYFPDEVLIVIGQEWFREANKTIGRMLSGWEGGTVR